MPPGVTVCEFARFSTLTFVGHPDAEVVGGGLADLRLSGLMTVDGVRVRWSAAVHVRLMQTLALVERVQRRCLKALVPPVPGRAPALKPKIQIALPQFEMVSES